MVKKKPQDIGLTPLRAISEGLVLVGRPFYFLLSRIFITVIFLLYTLGRITRAIATTIIRIIVAPFKSNIRRPKKGKLKTPEIKVPKIGTFLKLEGLRLSLLGQKILTGLKKLWLKKIKPVFKPGFRFRLKFFTVIFLLSALFLLLSFYFLIFRDLPSPEALENRNQEISTKIYDRNGNLLYKIYKDENRTIIPLTEIPAHVKYATLAAEDAEFYSHPGFSLKGITRAITTNIKTGKLQGGSTITQQLVKNALLTPEKTIVRKIKEIILSVRVELVYTKDEIFEMYLNEISYGGTAYGIEEASQEYFGKSARSLNLAEAAFLAGLTQSPTKFSPFGQDPSLGFARQKDVLRLMRINRYITKDEEEEARNQRVTFSANKKEIRAPHFVMYVRQLLVDEYGEDLVERGGLEVYTTLDLNIQEMAEKVVREEVEKLKSLKVGNGAALVLNPKTGEILAMVGSKNYFDIANDGNVNVTMRPRQPGSSIKVLNYAYALSHGYSPASIIDDNPITYIVPGSDSYSPKNYDGKFKGKISLRTALAESRNIPAVKVLASYGVGKMVEFGRQMGITTWDDTSRFGLSLTLGGGEVKLIELARIFATVANYGKIPEINQILEIKDYRGKTIQSKNRISIQKQLIDERVAYMLIDILKDNIARSGEFGLNSLLVVKNHPEVAVKTGTSNDLRDNLAVGFNKDFLVAVWVGNNDNTPMSRIASGITGATPIWNKIMTSLLGNSSPVVWEVPEKLKRVNICNLTGGLPCSGCPTRNEWFLEETKVNLSCTQEQIQKIIEAQKPDILETGIGTTNP